MGPTAEAVTKFEQSPIECLGQPVPTTIGGAATAREEGAPSSSTGDPLLEPLSDLEQRLRQSWGFEDRTVAELTADVDAARASLREYHVRLTASELAELRAREQLAEPASRLLRRAKTLPGFGGFFLDPLEGQYVLRVVGPTQGAEELSTILPPDRVRIEQADYTVDELNSFADRIVTIGDDGLVEIAAIDEPYRTLVADESISVGLNHTANRIHVWVTSDVSCDIVRTIVATIGDRGEIFAMGETFDD